MAEAAYDIDEERHESAAQKWGREISAAKKMLKRFHEQGDRVVSRFLDDRRNEVQYISDDYNSYKLNFFHSNITTIRSMLFGRVPKVDVSRRHADSDDDQARVASEILNRMLNNSVEDPGEGIQPVLRNALDDRLIPGLGTARVRYEYEPRMETIINEEGEEQQVEVGIEWESAPIDYVHWRDFLWSWTRVWGDLRWMAFRSYFDKKAMAARFGEEIADQAQYKRREVNTGGNDENPNLASATEEAEVWEIWCESPNKVYWWTSGVETLCDEQEDPLELDGFYPAPQPMAANVTTSLFVPKPDYCMAQDLYNEIDTLESRIGNITRAVKVVGVYDKNIGELQRMLKEGHESDLIPVENWAMLAEKGGLKGVVDWYPVENVVGVLSHLVELRNDSIQLLHEITGLSDIMRGSTDQYTSAASDKLKAKFGSVRIQAFQDMFAIFASDLMRLKAEVISKHFDPEQIVLQSNIMYTPDADMVGPAIELIKDPDFLHWRIEVRPESVAMVDFAQLKAERTEYLNGLSMFLQSGTSLIKEAPEAGPVLMQLLKWGLAGFKGSNEIEGVIDKALEQLMKAQSAPQEEQPDPEMQQAQMEMQMEQQSAQAKMQEEQLKHQNKLEEIQTKHATDMQRMQEDFKQDMQKIIMTGSINMEEEVAQGEAAIGQAQAEGQIDLAVEEGKEAIRSYGELMRKDISDE